MSEKNFEIDEHATDAAYYELIDRIRAQIAAVAKTRRHPDYELEQKRFHELFNVDTWIAYGGVEAAELAIRESKVPVKIADPIAVSEALEASKIPYNWVASTKSATLTRMEFEAAEALRASETTNDDANDAIAKVKAFTDSIESGEWAVVMVYSDNGNRFQGWARLRLYRYEPEKFKELHLWSRLKDTQQELVVG